MMRRVPTVVFVTLVLVGLAVAQFGPQCSNSNLGPASSGTLAYPSTVMSGDSYPFQYNTCDWQISVPAGSNVSLVFTHVLIEEVPGTKPCDTGTYIRLFDGASAAAPVMATICNLGLELPALVSSSDTLTLRLVTNDTTAHGGSGFGFVVNWTAIVADAQGPCRDFLDLTQLTGGSFGDPIRPCNSYPLPALTSSSDYSACYSVRKNTCSWLLRGTAFVQIQEFFNVHSAPMLAIHDGMDANAPLMGVLDPNYSQRNRIVRSTQPYMFLSLSDSEIYGAHRLSSRFNFSSVDNGQQCQGKIFLGDDINMTVANPYLYNAANHYEANTTCEWVYGSYDGTIEMTFTHFDLPDANLTVYQRYDNGYQYGFILDQFTGSTLPSGPRYYGGGIVLVFESGLGPVGSGFELTLRSVSIPPDTQLCSGTKEILYDGRMTGGSFSYSQPILDPLAPQPAIDCRWVFRSLDGQDRVVPNVAVNLITAYDCSVMSLDIYDGADTSAPRLARTCNTVQFPSFPSDVSPLTAQIVPSQVQSSGAAMLLHLRATAGWNGTVVRGVLWVTVSCAYTLTLHPSADDLYLNPALLWPFHQCAFGERSVPGQYYGDFYGHGLIANWWTSPSPVDEGRISGVLALPTGGLNCSYTFDGGPMGIVYMTKDTFVRSYLDIDLSPWDDGFANDTLTVYDGESLDAPVLGVFDYSHPIVALNSTGRYMTVHYLRSAVQTADPAGTSYLDAMGPVLRWRSRCPTTMYTSNRVGRTVEFNETTLVVTCTGETLCPGQYVSYCNHDSGEWEPAPRFCFFDAYYLSSTPIGDSGYECEDPSNCDLAAACPNYMDSSGAFHQREMYDTRTGLAMTTTDFRPFLTNETYYARHVGVCCFPFSCRTVAAALASVTIESLSPLLLPLRGGLLTLECQQCVAPLMAVYINGVPASAANQTSAGYYVVNTGPQTAGYASVGLEDANGQVGTYRQRALYFTDDCLTPGMYGKNGVCLPCPRGGECPGGNRIWPLQGFWNSGEESGFVEECSEPSNDRCLGGINATCGVQYEGAVCAQCVPGYYPSGVGCEKCPPAESQVALYVVAAVIFLALSVTLVVLKDAPLGYVIKAFKLLQALRLAGVRSGSMLPDGMRYINDYLSLITFDYEFLQPSCGANPTPASFEKIFWGNAVVLACLIFPSLLALAMLAILNHDEKRKFWVNRIYRALSIFASLIYYIVAARTLSAVTCIHLGDHYVLRADPNIACGANGVVIVGAIGLVLFTVAVPVGASSILVWLWRHDKLNDSDYQPRYGYLFRRLKVDHLRFLFDCVNFLHLFFIALAWNVFPTYGYAAYGFATFSYASMCATVVTWRPFISPRGTAFAITSYGLGLASTVSNLMTLRSNAVSPGATIGTVVAIGVAALGLAGLTYLRERRQKKKAIDKSAADESSKSADSGDEMSTASDASSVASSLEL